MLESDILIDTDVLIDYLREHSQAVVFIWKAWKYYRLSR